MTRKLYEEDAYCRQFEALVSSCCKVEKGYEVILEETAFFPEGGGQPADQGWLEDSRVTDVQEEEGIIRHICDKPLNPGSRVHGNIDWERRFLHMQQHSGEHIFSGTVHGLYGYDNIGFHMGKDFVTVDFSGLLSEEQIAEAQRRTNEVIFQNVEICAEYPSDEALRALEYRSKKEIDGEVRIVTIPGADVCACCGTHVKRTGEIGPVQVIGSEHYKSGIRLTLKIGWKALEDYEEKHRSVKEISMLLSASPEKIVEAVLHQQEQLKEYKEANISLKQKRMDDLVAAVPEGTRKAILFEEGLNPVEIRILADRLVQKVQFAAVFSGKEGEGYKYVMCGKDMDIVSLGKAFNLALNGRGGGKNPMVQGSVEGSEEAVREFLENWEKAY